MILRIFHKVVFAGLLAILLVSCVDAPLPVRIPEIKSVTSFCDGSRVVLHAELEGEPQLISVCGFMFGDDKDNLTKYPSGLNGMAFSTVILNVDYDKEYFYGAYAGNGRNEICTDIYIPSGYHPCIYLKPQKIRHHQKM